MLARADSVPHCNLVGMQVAAKASSRSQVKIQAVARNVESSSVGQKVATGVLAALVAAGSLLPAPVMAADLALGKQVFEGESLTAHLQTLAATLQSRHSCTVACMRLCRQRSNSNSRVSPAASQLTVCVSLQAKDRVTQAC
jgi:hypothetical protein